MRLAAALGTALALVALAFAPAPALAAPGGHEGHGASGPVNPMVKAITLFLGSGGVLETAAPAAGEVAAGAALPNGEGAPVAWSIATTRNTRLDSSVYVELYAKVNQATVTGTGPEGSAFRIDLLHNGQPVEGASSLQKLDANVLQPGGAPIRMKVFLPQKDLALAKGDTLGLQVVFFGLNPEGQPAVAYVLGGDQGSRMVFRLRMASLAELELPKEVGSAQVVPLEGYDFEGAAKKHPGAKVVTLRAFQFGFRGAPVTVDNGTRVVLQMTVDETLSTANEGHEGHEHGGAAGAWDQNVVAALHGFSLAELDPRLETVLFDGLVTILNFTASKPGNYTFYCTVFCGTGHGKMTDRLVVLGPEPVDTAELGPPDDLQPASKPLGAPGFEALAALGALGAAVALARRRGGA